MKTRIIAVTVLVAILSTSCYKDVISPGSDPNGPPLNVSFSGDLVPLLRDNCASAGCHDGVAHKPALTPELAYDAIINGGYVNTLVPSSSILYLEVKSGSMPPTAPLPARQSQLILDWVRNGAPNN